MKLVEPFAVLDIFASGIATIEVLRNGLARLTFYVEQAREGGPTDNVVTARIVLPADEAAKVIARCH